MGNTGWHNETSVEVVAFPYTPLQACVITDKAEVEWPPYDLGLYSLIIPSSPAS